MYNLFRSAARWAAVTLSANLDESEARIVKDMASREHRSTSSFIANAVSVYMEFPREVRDTLLELKAEKSSAALRAIIREFGVLVARSKFDLASRRLTDQKLLPDIAEDATDQDILDQASALARGL